MPKKRRIDHILVERSFFPTRTEAQKAILSGFVKVASQIVQKSSQLFDPDVSIDILNRKRYVSRGGEKLENALQIFSMDIHEKVVLDIGSSTGGFVDCLLQHGAQKVYAVDVGYGQLDLSLRKDSRVIVMERMNARYLEEEDFPEKMDLVTIDVSFISLKKILPCLMALLKPDARIVALIKPQFEVGKGQVGKGGVVRDEGLRLETIQKIKDFAVELGLESLGVCVSPLKGPAGNVEYFIFLKEKKR
jgi:23S rRNA (cytidine1920-2'-O)/16S rRNA (cytidine1409-2'-O)-methyltransferase